MRSMYRLIGILLGSLAASTVCFALVSTLQQGWWPDSWPKELEPLRKQARTVRVAHGISETVYEIPFKSREDFEKAWPHILKLKSKGASLILEKSPYKYLVSGSESTSGVMILSSDSGYVGGPNTPRAVTVQEMEALVKQGKMLSTSPPWPEYLYSAKGELPAYVGMKEEDGKLKWVPADTGNRARIDIILISDGKIVDLNRIQIPANTLIVDNRFR
jgi:hypothetical protein